MFESLYHYSQICWVTKIGKKKMFNFICILNFFIINFKEHNFENCKSTNIHACNEVRGWDGEYTLMQNTNYVCNLICKWNWLQTAGEFRWIGNEKEKTWHAEHPKK